MSANENELLLLRQSLQAIRDRVNEQLEALAAQVDRLLPEEEPVHKDYAGELDRILRERRQGNGTKKRRDKGPERRDRADPGDHPG